MKNFKTLLLFLSIPVLANVDHWIGEKDFDLYFGPHNPKLYIERRVGSSKFLDDKYQDIYFTEKLAPSLYDLNDFYIHNIASNFSCSINDFSKSKGYIHYLYRLSALSLHYEFLRKIHIGLYQINESEKKCDLSFDEIFKNCNPKSLEMKKFVKRVDQFFPDIIDWGRYPLLRKNATYENLKKHQKNSTEIIVKNFSDDNIESSYLRACKKTKEEINNICNEVDSYYALNSLGEIKKKIINSSAFKNINSEDSGQACIEKFGEVFAKSENVDIISSYILKNEVSSLDKMSETIFWYGSLKEFDDLGVEIIAENKPVVKQEQPIKILAPEITIVKDEAVVEDLGPDLKEVVVFKKMPDLVITSAFTDALLSFRKSRKNTEFNMTKMKTDFKYSKRILNNLNGPLKPYQTRKALQDMKVIDKLGTINSPLSYLFLRFMIDYKLHQGLYNIKAILGDEFYIINDIEDNKDIVKIRLDNNEDTKFKWQIWILEASS